MAARFPDGSDWSGAFQADVMVAGVVLYARPTVCATCSTSQAQQRGGPQSGGALDLLFEETIRAVEPSVRYFDFGASTEDGGRVLNQGLMDQKEGFWSRDRRPRSLRAGPVTSRPMAPADWWRTARSAGIWKVTPTLYEAHYGEGFSLERVLIEARRRSCSEPSSGHGGVARSSKSAAASSPSSRSSHDFDARSVVEPSPRFVAHARQLAADDPRVTIVEGFIEEVADQLSGTRFDLVVVSSLLHEVPDPGALLRAIHSACGPSTIVHVNVPNVRSFHRLLAVEMGVIDSVFTQSETEVGADRQLHDSTRRSLRAMFKGARVGVLLGSGLYFLIKPFTHEQIEPRSIVGIIDRAVVVSRPGEDDHYLPRWEPRCTSRRDSLTLTSASDVAHFSRIATPKPVRPYPFPL